MTPTGFCRHLAATLGRASSSNFTLELKNKNKFISNHRERMHDIYRSLCQNKNDNFLFTKSAIECEIAQHMHITNCK